MKKLQKKFTTQDKVEYYTKHLEIVNLILNGLMDKKEVELIASFLSLDDKFIRGYLFNPTARKKVRELLNLEHSGLSNYLRKLVNKKMMVKDEITKQYSLIPQLIADNPKQEYELAIELSGNSNEGSTTPHHPNNTKIPSEDEENRPVNLEELD